MATFAASLASVKARFDRFLPEPMIDAARRAAGHRWRCRKLPPATTP